MNAIVRKGLVCGMALILGGLASAPAFAGAWAFPGGTAAHFSYSNGGDINGLFGDPLVFGDTFYFMSANFVANAQNGNTVTVADTVAWDVVVNAGYQLSGIQVFVFGDYNVQGAGSSANLDASLTVAENGGMLRSFSDTVAADPPVTFPITSGAGTYTASAAVDVISYILPPIDDELHISFSNELLTISGGEGQSSVLNLSFQEASLIITFIPEPATAILLGLGVLGLIRRGR